MSIPTYPTYSTYNSDNLTCLKPEYKQPKIPGKSIPPFHMIPLTYNSGTEDAPVFSEFFELELCEFTSPQGITEKESTLEAGKMDHSILIKFDPTNQEHEKCATVLQDVYMKCASLVGLHKHTLKKNHFDPTNPIAGTFKPLIYIAEDEFGQVVQGKLPCMFLKLFSRGTGVFNEHTVFVDGYNKPIDHKLLYGVQLTFVPLLRFRGIRVASTISFQVELKSAAVIDIKKRNAESTQLSTIHSLAATRPDYASKLADQLAKLSTDRQESPLPVTNQEEKEKTQTGTSTNSGIEPTDNEKTLNNIQNAVNKAPKRDFKPPF
jgi:hypothetical protein